MLNPDFIYQTSTEDLVTHTDFIWKDGKKLKHIHIETSISCASLIISAVWISKKDVFGLLSLHKNLFDVVKSSLRLHLKDSHFYYSLFYSLGYLCCLLMTFFILCCIGRMERPQSQISCDCSDNWFSYLMHFLCNVCVCVMWCI